MKRILRNVLILVIAITGIWYFGLKEEHYQISFTTRQPAGMVYHHILDWKADKFKGIDSIEITGASQYSEVSQRLHVGDSVFTYLWKFQKTEDSLTRVDVAITDEVNGLMQKLQVPFAKNAFVKRSIKNVADVGDALVLKSKKFKVHSFKDTVFGGGYCIYLPLKSTVSRKASTMLYRIPDLMGYIKDNDIPLQGDPYLEVTQWDKESSEIEYNFCFPIAKSDSLPPTDLVLFKETPKMRALKAEFNGNYSISDNAWYYLLEYAERNELKVKSLPTELYLNDPHTTGNPIEWKANIFLPLTD